MEPVTFTMVLSAPGYQDHTVLFTMMPVEDPNAPPVEPGEGHDHGEMGIILGETEA